jgi:hypothetical protein
MTVIRFESSFVDLYSGEVLAADVIDWLSDRGFCVRGIFNPAYDVRVQAVPGNLILCRGGTAGQLEDSDLTSPATSGETPRKTQWNLCVEQYK